MHGFYLSDPKEWEMLYLREPGKVEEVKCGPLKRIVDDFIHELKIDWEMYWANVRYENGLIRSALNR